MFRVMIVEDERIEREALTELLHNHFSHEISDLVLAGNGEDAFAALAADPPDLVFLDIHIPKINGLELLRRMNRQLETEIIIISAYSNFEYAQQALSLGVRDYLVKPVDLEAFRRVVTETFHVLRKKTLVKEYVEHILKNQSGGFLPVTQQEYTSYLVNEVFLRFSELSFSDNQKDAADYLLTHIISEDHASTNVQQLFAFLVAFFQSLDLPNNEFLTSIDVDLVHREDVLADVPIDHLESLITDFINHIHLLLSKDPNQKETQRIVGTIDAYLENHYDEDIDLKHLGLEVNRNPSYISSLYKQKTGMNVKDRLRRIRIQAARELLEKGGFSVKEVAYTVGFSDPNYFSTVFKRETGLSATDYMLFYHKNIEEI